MEINVRSTSFHCSDLYNHIESFSNQPTPPEHGIRSQFASNCDPALPPKEKQIQPMDLGVYKRLFRFSSLMKIVRIVAINQYMRDLMKEETLTLQNSIMLLQPKYLKLIRNYKPSSQELSSAFYKIIRTSQYNNKPSTKYFRPITLSNALITASLRYEDKKAEELLGVKFLP